MLEQAPFQRKAVGEHHPDRIWLECRAYAQDAFPVDHTQALADFAKRGSIFLGFVCDPLEKGR